MTQVLINMVTFVSDMHLPSGEFGTLQMWQPPLQVVFPFAVCVCVCVLQYIHTYVYIYVRVCVCVRIKPSKGLTNELFHPPLIVTLADSNVPSLTVFLLNKHNLFMPGLLHNKRNNYGYKLTENCWQSSVSPAAEDTSGQTL